MIDVGGCLLRLGEALRKMGLRYQEQQERSRPMSLNARRDWREHWALSDIS